MGRVAQLVRARKVFSVLKTTAPILIVVHVVVGSSPTTPPCLNFLKKRVAQLDRARKAFPVGETTAIFKTHNLVVAGSNPAVFLYFFGNVAQVVEHRIRKRFLYKKPQQFKIF